MLQEVALIITWVAGRRQDLGQGGTPPPLYFKGGTACISEGNMACLCPSPEMGSRGDAPPPHPTPKAKQRRRLSAPLLEVAVKAHKAGQPEHMVVGFLLDLRRAGCRAWG